MVAVWRLMIRFYQRRLSPHKGFRCAHSALHAGPSCSAAVLNLIEGHGGLFAARQAIKARFAACQESADEMRRRREGRNSAEETMCCIAIEGCGFLLS